MSGTGAAVFVSIPNARVLAARLSTCLVDDNGTYKVNKEKVAKVLWDAEAGAILTAWLSDPAGPRRLFHDLDVSLLPDHWIHGPAEFVRLVVNAIADAGSTRIIEEGMLSPTLNYATPYIAFRFAGGNDRMLVVYL